MCGIGGLILSPCGPLKAEWMEAFLRHLEHRGPDDSGWLCLRRDELSQGENVRADLVGDVALFHRRLSIIDLSAAGRQPMGTADGRYWIVFNGEIYNYKELREELRLLGHRFTTHSDTEVLLAAYVQWGTRAFTRLVGMFAFAVVDRRARRVMLARDFFGIKPLYYAFWQDGLAFASEIRPLLELPGVTRRVNPRRLFDYLYFGITHHGEETMFEDIRQVPPAHCIDMPFDQPQAARPLRYWGVNPNAGNELSFTDATQRVRELFLDSVKFHLRSDVPVGAALSGGIDSSSIVMAMRHLDRNADIHVFSYIANDAAISEERWVDLVATAAKVHLHKIRVNSTEWAADLDHLIGVQGEPFISTGMYAQCRVFREARAAGIKVMLDGQGADELFAGYPSYQPIRLRSLLHQGRWREALLLARATSNRRTDWIALGRAWAGLAPAGIQTRLRRWSRRDAAPSWLNVAWFHKHGVRTDPAPRRIPKQSFKAHLYGTLTETSLPQLLHYEDHNSMAYSIESRVPFLTPALAQFVLALPDDYLLASDGTTKFVFRQAMRGIVPDAILNRRDKLGFPTPERNWLISMKGWVYEVLTSDAAARFGALNAEALRLEWRAIVQGRRALDSQVWRWINAILWAEKFCVAVE